MNAIGLNHRVAPAMAVAEFFDLALALGVTEVEIRNDLPGVAIADGTPPEAVRREAEARGITILTINALYPFNIWTGERAEQAAKLIDYAATCGAKGLVMCPLNDASYAASQAERMTGLREALTGLAPLLRRAGLVGLVEPLGFPESSLRLKRLAVEAIAAVDDSGTFKLVHDTFHHHVAGETEFFPEHTGLVHISGIVDAALRPDDMKDAHRVLVDADDRIDNLGQIRSLALGGYAGPLSFEPFADSVSHAADIRSLLKDSIALVRQAETIPAR